MKRILSLIFISFLKFYTVNAQTAPTALSVSNITENAATISWTASTATPSTATKIESFEQAFSTSFWSSNGYNWLTENSDIRDYNNVARTGSACWFIARNNANLTFNVPSTLRGLWIRPNSVSSYTIKAYDVNNTEIYSRTVTVSFSNSYSYLTLNWNNVKKISLSYVSSGSGPSGTIYIDDLNYTPSENVYPYYISTVNTAPASNETASGQAAGTSINLGSLQPLTTYYLWMRTYDGNSNGSWTASPVSFTTTNVLPVVLNDFTAKKEHNYAVLKWTTLSENNNRAFIISHATDGKDFKVLAEIQGKGSGSSVNTYQYEHLSPFAGTNYYKLVQVDFNGDSKELGIKVVDFKLNDNISLYPNPVVEKAIVSFNEGYQSIELINGGGKVLQRINIANTDTSKEISLANYPPAVYFIKLSGVNKTDVRKVIKH